MLAAGFVHDLSQIRAGHEIHDQVVPLLLGEVVGDLGKVGVVQPGQDAGLLVELLLGLSPCLRAGSWFQADLLEGAHPAFQPQILGLIDRSGASLPHQLDDLVPFSQNGGRRQHLVQRSGSSRGMIVRAPID